jgi:hygromycin-B 7''-O-kinase
MGTGSTHPLEAPDDPALSKVIVLELAHRAGVDATHVTFVDESGRKGRAYILDDEVILKTHRPQRLRSRLVEEFETSVEKEAFFLRQLGTDPEIQAPRYLGYGLVDGLEYVCMSRLSGITLRHPGVTPAQRHAVLSQLGRLLARIHRLAPEPFVSCGLFPHDGGPEELRAKLAKLFRQVVEAHRSLPHEAQLPGSVEAIAARALEALPSTARRVPLHSNPAGEHVFFDPQTTELVGLIDYGDAYIGHPAFDLRPYRDAEDREALLAGYAEVCPVDEDFRQTWRVGLVLGELANVLRQREPPDRSEARLRPILEEL